MSEFIPKKIDLETINGGKKYKNGDSISPTDLNALIEGVGAGGDSSPFKWTYLGSGSGSWSDINGEGRYCLTDFGTINSGDIYLLVDETVGIFGTMSIAFDSDQSSYVTELYRKELETNFDYWGLGNFVFSSVWYGYYYIAIENNVNNDLSQTLANLKVYKLTVEA